MTDLQNYDMPVQNQAHSSYVGQGLLKYEALEPSEESLVVPNNGIAEIFNKQYQFCLILMTIAGFQ